MNDTGPQLPHPYVGGLSRRQFLMIVSLFWLYVTLSNVVYAYSMRTGVAKVTDAPLFAAWDDRVVQHALLFPLVLVSYWASLRIQWRPFWIAIPSQILLGTVFSAMAYPAMLLGENTLDNANLHERWLDHVGTSFFSDPMVLPFWLASFVTFLPVYGFGLALVTGLALYTRFRDSELHVAALEREWSTARLAALRMQLSPHTLFNLLHTIRGHIDWDPQGAQSMVVQLADLLRKLLNAGERDFAKLTDELQFVRLYLELQQRRFADRLTVILPEPHEVLAVWVPSLILQPLVENAVVHGLAGHQGPVIVRVSLSAADDLLTLRVANTIADRKAPPSDGIGLKNVRERLAVQFPGRSGFICGAHGTEWISEITMPEIHDSPERRAVRHKTPLVSA